jgi:ABC-type nitrate/sulfonate/bicarbonate transport system substrate-binding protein
MKNSLYGIRQRFIAAGLILLLTLSGFPVVAAGLTIAVSRSPLSLPLYVAESQGYFAAEGVQVTLKDAVGGVRAMRDLADDQTDLVTTSDTTIVFNSFSRNDFAVLATFASSSKHIGLVVGKSAGYARPEHLAGKRIGTVVGSAGQFYSDSWLIFHGIDPKTTRSVSLQPETMVTALAKGEVEAVAIWEPYRRDILKIVPGATLLPNPGIYTVSLNLVADRNLLGPRDEELTRVLRALLRAEQFIGAEPAKAQAILRERLKLEQAYVDQVWPNYRYRLSLEQSLLTTLESEARWTRQEGHVRADRSPNFLGFIYAGPLRKTSPDRVGIGR